MICKGIDIYTNYNQFAVVSGQVETAETAETTDSFFCPHFPRFRPYSKTRKPQKIMKYIKYWGFNFYLPFLYIQMPQINVYTVNHSTPYPKGS